MVPGPPPVLTSEGKPALEMWEDLCGVEYSPGRNEGMMAPGRQVCFEGVFSAIPSQIILTHFLVDHIYPVIPRDNTEVVARAQGNIVGTHRRLDGGGSMTFLGYRPRDDQSGDLPARDQYRSGTGRRDCVEEAASPRFSLGPHSPASRSRSVQPIASAIP